MSRHQRVANTLSCRPTNSWRELEEFLTVPKESSQTSCKMLMTIFYVIELGVIDGHFIILMRIPDLQTASTKKDAIKWEGNLRSR